MSKHKKQYKIGANATQPITSQQVYEDNPIIKTQRSKFNISTRNYTTFNEGKLIPLKCIEIIPGDTIELNIASIVRGLTPLTPVMDTAHLDIWAFYCDNEKIYPTVSGQENTTNGYSRFRELMGEDLNNNWASKTPDINSLTLPAFDLTNNNWKSGTIADYLNMNGHINPDGTATNAPNVKVASGPINMYNLIWNEWFRDQNFSTPNQLLATEFNALYSTDANIPQLGGQLLPLAKFADYFTTCLPSTQRGQSPILDLAITLNNDIPVISKTEKYTNTQTDGIHLKTLDGSNFTHQLFARAHEGTENNDYLGNASQPSGTSVADQKTVFDNLWAAASQTPETANLNLTINDLRQAFQTQKLMEHLARSGARYSEIILSEFGIQIMNDRQKPELLGEWRVEINAPQIAQTSQTSNQNPLGNLASYQHTMFGCDQNKLIKKSFDKHGYIMIVGGIRQENTYIHGIQKQYTRLHKFDFYSPVFQALGEQPVYKYEIYTQNSEENTNIFGYLPAWEEYRVGINQASGEFKKLGSGNTYGLLDAWTYINDFKNEKGDIVIPNSINENFIYETSNNNIKRTLYTIENQTNNHFWMGYNIYLEIERPMPVSGVPGLIDHF